MEVLDRSRRSDGIRKTKGEWRPTIGRKVPGKARGLQGEEDLKRGVEWEKPSVDCNWIGGGSRNGSGRSLHLRGMVDSLRGDSFLRLAQRLGAFTDRQLPKN
jgi:hypothetical protein